MEDQKEGGDMANVFSSVFSLVVRYEEIKGARPHKGWTIYTKTPKGLKPLMSKRGNLKRFSTLDRVFPWAMKNFEGYGLQIEGPFQGGLIPAK